jgi:hypothetical protein
MPKPKTLIITPPGNGMPQRPGGRAQAAAHVTFRSLFLLFRFEESVGFAPRSQFFFQ